jgi:hypothetical protein
MERYCIVEAAPATEVGNMKTSRSKNDLGRVRFGKAYAEVKAWLEIGCIKYTIIFVPVLLSLALLLNVYQKWQRNLLFCEVIQPKISLAEVSGILDKYGKFGTAQYEQGEDTLILLVIPLDFTAMRYGGRGLELAFRDDALGSVIERYHLEDGIRNLCE